MRTTEAQRRAKRIAEGRSFDCQGEGCQVEVGDYAADRQRCRELGWRDRLCWRCQAKAQGIQAKERTSEAMAALRKLAGLTR